MSDESSSPREPRSVRARVRRVVVIGLLVALVIVVLFTTVFPWVEERTQVPTIGAVGSIPATVVVSD